MIDLRTEHLIPLKDLPAYLESRGLGRRISVATVRRWIREDAGRPRLETVHLGRTQLTSCEAVQRWMEVRNSSRGPDRADAHTPSGELRRAGANAGGMGHATSRHYLVECRVVPTELDSVINELKSQPRAVRTYVAGALFRAGLRTREDVQCRGLDSLLSIPGIGTRSREVVRSLWQQVARRLDETRTHGRTP